MSKGIKNVQVKLEKSKDTHGNDMNILKIGNNAIGEILTVNGHLEAHSDKGKTYNINGIDEGIADLLSEYHLHK